MIQNYVTSGTGRDQNITTHTTYTADGAVKTLTADNADTGNQLTTYSYGTTLTASGVARKSLLVTEKYPDSISGSDVVAYEYNRQSQVIKRTDQNGTIRTFEFDKLGRPTADIVGTPGAGVDSAARRIDTSYNSRGLPELVTSYSSITGSSASIVNQVRREYNDFAQLATEYQQTDDVVDTQSSPKVQYAYNTGSADSGATNNNIRPTKVTYPNLKELDYGYGASSSDDYKLSRVLKLTFDTMEVANYIYTGIGAVIKVDYPEPNVRYTINLKHR